MSKMYSKRMGRRTEMTGIKFWREKKIEKKNHKLAYI